MRISKIITLTILLLVCYVYSLAVGDGERLTHAIRVPLDPGIYDSIEIPTDKCLYLFSTAVSRGAVGTTKIAVNTPCGMTGSSLKRLVTGEGTYTLTTTGNPETELYFEPEERYELPPQETAAPEQVPEIVEKETWKPWIFVCSMFLGACLMAGTVVHFQIKKTENP